ncbi:uncharacterized protein LOC112494488 [Cephus cinctus]|uniref:Uncharacterized protein LOC112494488 n=1 Tax=Cephus cinctus TaxID=211228 RepID=A0AAJ7W205_CEPCN|nr:uncharacterized protein LOC112494488 [Cephus cinctus]
MRACFILMWLMLFVIKLTAADTTDSKYCFQFTWLGSMYDNHSTVNINCTTYEGVPCFEPFVITGDSTQPNVTYMWDTFNHANITCPLRSGYTCIKYTFVYNNAGKYTSDMLQSRATSVE